MNENEGDPDCQERASLSASSRLPWKMKKTMADGEQDETERGKHRRHEEREIATYLEMNEKDRRRRRCSAIGRRRRRCSGLVAAASGRVSFWSFSPNFCLPSIGTRVLL